jgi:hypothetical protein
MVVCLFGAQCQSNAGPRATVHIRMMSSVIEK